MIITRQLLRNWNACYKDERIAELVPDSGLTPIQLIDLEIPDVDRIWGACNVLARYDRHALIALAHKWAADAAAAAAAADAAANTARWAANAAATNAADAAAAARWATANAADAADGAANAARWAANADAANAAADAANAAAFAASRWTEARKQQIADCREALLRLETVT